VIAAKAKTALILAAMLAAWSLPLAAHTRTSENSRLGLEAFVNAPQAGFAPVNQQNALGLRADVRQTHVRSRCTGKERDAETGLDYFGARYMSSAQGPDQPFADQHVEDPQSWNMYGYVRNNPLRHTDPDGRACSSLIGNTGSGFCQRAAEYASARYDADPRISSQTRFFAAAAAVSEAVANVDGPGLISRRFVSSETATFLEKNIGQDLQQLNSRAVEDIRMVR